MIQKMEDPKSSFIRFYENFAPLSTREEQNLMDRLDLEVVKRGECYLGQGKVCRKVGFIANGVMRYCNLKDDGSVVTCYFIAENEFAFDAESFGSGRPSTLMIEALTDCLVISISKDDEHWLKQNLPKFMEASNRMGQEFMVKLINQRQFLLNQDAKSRYLHFLKEYPAILQRAPLGAVASFLGITQQSLSRLRSQLG